MRTVKNYVLQIILFAFGIAIIFSGCTEEELTTEILHDQSIEAINYTGYTLNSNTGDYAYETITQPADYVHPPPGVVLRANSTNAHGNFNTATGNVSITFSGSQNNGGAHGSGEFRNSIPGVGTDHVLFDTRCLSVVGNSAVYSGIITEVLENTIPPPPPPPPPIPAPPPPIAVGNVVVFNVIDNGQGNNALPDQHSELFLFVPDAEDFCETTPSPDSPFWTLFGVFPLADVGGANDKIKVNH